MVKQLKKYLPFTRAGIQAAAAYRMNFIFFILGNFLACFITYYLWRAVYSSSGQQNLEGFTLTDMTLYIFVSFLSGFIVSAQCHWEVAEEIREGTISMRLIKPVNFNMTYLFQELGQKFIVTLFLLIPIVVSIEIYRTVTTGIFMFNFINFSIYLVSIILAFLISFYFSICFGFSAFIFKYFWGTSIMMDSIVRFLSGAMIPIVFFPAGIQGILSFLPFASLIYTPVMLYMGMYSKLQIVINLCLQVFWILFFLLLSKLIWSIVIKRLNVQGG